MSLNKILNKKYFIVYAKLLSIPHKSTEQIFKINLKEYVK